MAYSKMDITPHTISFGNHVIQTKNIATATVVNDENRENFINGMGFFSVVAIGAGLYFIKDFAILIAVGIALATLAYFLGYRYDLVISTGDGKVTALRSSNKSFMEKVLDRIKQAMTTNDPSFSYHVNVDGLKIVEGNEVNVSGSEGAQVAGGNISS